MSGQKSSSKKRRLIEDVIAVEDIILEYVIDSGWKDYQKFARILTDKIVESQPSSREALARLVGGLVHPFFAFNQITKEQFINRFPVMEFLQQSHIPRSYPTHARDHRPKKRMAISKKVRFLVFERDGFRCVVCGRNAKETKLEVDHKVPVAKDGTDSLNNLRTLCIDCNRGKSDMSL
jgi:hypothetical protein